MTQRIRFKLKKVSNSITLYLFSMNANVPSVFHPAAEILSNIIEWCGVRSWTIIQIEEAIIEAGGGGG